jgi:hypothetical protein
MNVNSGSWHARVYLWWYQQKYGKTKLVDDWHLDRLVAVEVPNIPERTNLCPYMRAVMFWSWMRWLFIGGKVWKIPTPAIIIPILLFELPRWAGMLDYGLKNFILTFYAVTAGVALAVGGLAGLGWLNKHTAFGKKMKKVDEGLEQFGALVKAYSRSKHDRICPEITFVKEDASERVKQ